MTASYQKVLSGLRLSSIGLWLVAMSVVLLTSVGLYSNLYLYRDGVHSFAVALIVPNIQYGSFGLCGLGLVVGFVGRCLCLPVPAAAGSAPARIGLTVIFEACSLLSAAALIGVAFLPLPPLPSYIPLTWTLFIGLTAYIARMQFLRFARSLAEHLNPSLVPEAKAVRRLYLYVPGGFILAYGIAAGSVFLQSSTGDDFYKTIGMLLGWLVATAATVLGVIGVWRWSGLLAGLRKAVVRTKVVYSGNAADDPDREYRSHYPADPS